MLKHRKLLSLDRCVAFPIPEIGAFLIMVVLGTTLTLPPGPLCDEGMILFMEGGCDWGASNLFFFSKIGMLITANLVLLGALVAGRLDWRTHMPHFVALGVLAALTATSSCDDYYSHPNGSHGQMLLEIAALSAFGLMLFRRLPPLRPSLTALLFVIWNLSYPAIFYLHLSFTNHWTWQHTGLVSGTFVAVGMLFEMQTQRTSLAAT